MARPKSASFTAAPLSLEASSRFSGFPGPERRGRGQGVGKRPENSEQIQNLTSGSLGLQEEQLGNPEGPCPHLQLQLQALSFSPRKATTLLRAVPPSTLLRVWAGAGVRQGWGTATTVRKRHHHCVGAKCMHHLVCPLSGPLEVGIIIPAFHSGLFSFPSACLFPLQDLCTSCSPC